MNKRCVALSQEERSIELLRNGFMLSGVLVKPNERIATIEVLQATLGLIRRCFKAEVIKFHSRRR